MTGSQAHLQTTVGARPAPRPRPLVLVTDDDEDIRSLLCTILSLRGYAVVEAADGEEAVRLAEGARPDLILMDASLPRLDGLAATRRIRRLAHAAGVPVIFLSGHAHPTHRAAAREAGCDDYLVKPFGLEQLAAALDRHLGRPAEPAPPRARA